MEGIYFANVYDSDTVKMLQAASISAEIKHDYTSKKISRDAKDLMISGMSNIKNFKKTVMTCDKGGIWRPVEAP